MAHLEELPIFSPPEVDRIWLWVYLDKLPIYPIFYLLKVDYSLPRENLRDPRQELRAS